MMTVHLSGGWEGGRKLQPDSGGCAGVKGGRDQLRGRGGLQLCRNKNEFRSVLDHTTYGTGKVTDWIQHCTGWISPTWTWCSFRTPRSPAASTRGVERIQYHCS